ncbi:5-bromo-4-chloroindolyl phosphate hydrolysis family protein [Clostridium sp. YIM B02505]|uniref:5-bromo-4-chloroindolyl phosphate hydrolysis family protein n=1 Tax=Clostridium yunnanense TaxID=2800325 RepID=A0ABS1EKC3_9CLOT|nr:5-bromo-4-chloroindolyl phosphate hydrolysis family protein [Clostridium yunnanense]MBK1809805.1 5-bromo-4-chloroindolyl phosphate hydrolysis family protein [Clostridium yunnanense]
MSKLDFSDLEREIKDTVKNALDSIDIDINNLKQDFNNKAEDTINEVKETMKNKTKKVNEKIKDKMQNQYRNVNDLVIKDQKEIQKYVDKKPVGRVSGVVYMSLGITGSVVFGIQTVVYAAFISVLGKFLIANLVGLGVLASFFIISMGMTFKGISLRKRVRRFRKYISCLGNSGYCNIEKLAKAIGEKEKFVVKDLRKMIELGMFTQGHLDDNNTLLMISNEVYDNYLDAQAAYKKRKEDELRNEKKEQEEEKINDIEDEQLKSTLEIGNNYIEQIKKLNDSIHVEIISAKLDRLQNIVRQILNFVENNPKKLSAVSKFIRHYLPMTYKLISTYKELNDQAVQGENIKKSKVEIENTIDTVNHAFEKLLDDLFADVALDISTDISVLQTLFTQEGLTKNDFKK